MSDIKDDDRLRQHSLCFYEQEIERIHTILDHFLRRSQATCVMLIDVEGHLVTTRGELGDFDEHDFETLCTLLAGTFAATRTWAQLLGVKEFSELYHQGDEANILVKSIGYRALATIVFNDSTNLGLVKLMSGELGKKLQEIFQVAEEHGNDMPMFIDGIPDENDVKNKLDELFG